MNKLFFISSIVILIFFLSPAWLLSQSDALYRIEYMTNVNGQDAGPENRKIVFAGKSFSTSESDTTGVKFIKEKPYEKDFIDYEKLLVKQVASLHTGSVIHQESSFSELPILEPTHETETIIGYRCKKMTTVIRSNKIEIWFTNDLEIKGTPSYSNGVPDGLVLRIRRNNNWELAAKDIKKLKTKTKLELPENTGEKMDSKNYRHNITQSYVQRINIFNDEQICWGSKKINPVFPAMDSVFRYAGGTVILKKLKLPRVTADYQVFAEITQYSNGDAYDRTGTIFMINDENKLTMLTALNEGIDKVPFFAGRNGKKYEGMKKTGDFDPAIELMRFFTSFGIGHYNDKVQVVNKSWQPKSHFKQEITEMLPLIKGEVWIGAFIGNYDSGGHKLSLDLVYYPGSQTIEEIIPETSEIIPLFNTLNFMEMAGQNYGTFFDKDSLEVNFEITDTSKNYTLRYITTGHGGWENGDEFVQKVNSIFLDEKLIFSYIPWRTDCMNFREFNPSSGNFWNGLSSSDYSRSGWCPGSVTVPSYIQLGRLNAGRHSIKVAIPQGADEGSSFSAWNVSGVLIGK
ncbi:MAG: GLPGLI family protein [Deltaproteobacteria bacterium]